MISILGCLIAVLGSLMFLPAAIDLAFVNEDWHAFVAAGCMSVSVGVALFLVGRHQNTGWTTKNSIIFVNALWIFVCFFAALPLYLSSLELSFTDAFFETASGLTTTGSTVLNGLDNMAPGILFWRSMLQWIGGLGIVAIGVSILPSLGTGGQRLFYMESSDQSDKPFPRVREFAGRIILIYLLLTTLCAFAYFELGMSVFEAINHSMTTVSTGGFSTSDDSIWHFHSLGILVVASFFMFLGGLPFLYLIKLFSPNPVHDPQVRLYFFGVIAASLLIFTCKEVLYPEGAWHDLVFALFNVISIVTTTGFAAGDYQLWGALFGAVFLVLTFFGACSGSTSGGLKQFRFVVIWQMIRQSIMTLGRPHQIVPMRYANRSISDDIVSSTLGLVFIFFATFMIFGLMLEIGGLDFITAMSASATALANVGPGLGEVIGPAGNFSSLPDFDKWLLSVEMILGRLEILSGYALLLPSFWKW
ncbi:TrkH family potassium uptake protein [Cohaesibacter gelatinilyticus]|uniref:Trk system potassium uptake protein n=1 Tax=Cohaesibacter gelatinilyticus TaxID=372072 RepID=A0A285NH59_9HYPH|nr:TrkH family potassium uptake protein [Cohaesibacter gelatinilyticus]SNZ08253.1 trk system potassium uptake protein TrkH [Cohaesibacter gelatinilyticus]